MLRALTALVALGLAARCSAPRAAGRRSAAALGRYDPAQGLGLGGLGMGLGLGLGYEW